MSIIITVIFIFCFIATWFDDDNDDNEKIRRKKKKRYYVYLVSFSFACVCVCAWQTACLADYCRFCVISSFVRYERQLVTMTIDRNRLLLLLLMPLLTKKQTTKEWVGKKPEELRCLPHARHKGRMYYFVLIIKL